jgi:hypothetical protein
MELPAIQEAICTAIRALRLQDSNTYDDYSRETYDKYKETVAAFEFYNALSAQLSSCDLHVLDVGAGELMTARMLSPLGNHNINTYTAVDHKDCPDEHVQTMTKRTQTFRVVPTDYRELMGLPMDFYDVVIIDIEPHGEEIEVYRQVVKHLKPLHLCILKHVGFIDMCGCIYADEFLSKYIEDNKVYDYFAEYHIDIGLRDIFVIMSRNNIDCNLKCQLLAQGKPVQWGSKRKAYTFE